jgi:hypothetical protein
MTYISPPIGGYFEHFSGCSREFVQKMRPAIWDETWASTGTRRSHCFQKEPLEKWFCELGTAGGSKWVAKADVEVDDKVVYWKTFWAPSSPPHEADVGDVARRKRLRRQQEGLNERFRIWVEVPEEASRMREHVKPQTVCIAHCKVHVHQNLDDRCSLQHVTGSTNSRSGLNLPA